MFSSFRLKYLMMVDGYIFSCCSSSFWNWGNHILLWASESDVSLHQSIFAFFRYLLSKIKNRSGGRVNDPSCICTRDWRLNPSAPVTDDTLRIAEHWAGILSVGANVRGRFCKGCTQGLMHTLLHADDKNWTSIVSLDGSVTPAIISSQQE